MAPIKTGIMDIYVVHAEDQIKKHAQAGTIRQISRHTLEQEILQGLDEATFPIDMKISWYNTILYTSVFEALWSSAAIRYNLNTAQTTRYTPDASLQEYTVPDGYSKPTPFDFASPSYPTKKKTSGRKRQPNTKARKSTTKQRKPNTKHTPPATPAPSSSDIDSRMSDSDSDEATPAQRAFAAKLGRVPQPAAPMSSPESYVFDMQSTNSTVPDANGLLREEGDDGAYGAPAKNKRGGRGAGRGRSVRAGDKGSRAGTPTPKSKPKPKPTPKGSAKHVKSAANPKKATMSETLKRKREEAITRGIVTGDGTADVLGDGTVVNGVSASGRKRVMTAKASAI